MIDPVKSAGFLSSDDGYYILLLHSGCRNAAISPTVSNESEQNMNLTLKDFYSTRLAVVVFFAVL